MNTADIRSALENWYERRVAFTGANISDLDTPASGVVNETYIHTVQFRQDGQSASLSAVVRLQPATADTPIPNVDVMAQAFLLRKLSAVGGLLTPEVLWEESDSSWLGRPFYVMECMDGDAVFDTGGAPDDAATLRSMYEQTLTMLARIHAVDWAASGLQPIYAGTDEVTPLRARLNEYRFHLDQASTEKRYPLLEEAYAWLDANIPPETAPVLNWGDARVGNLLFDDGKLTAVLDWEIADITAREVDMGWFLFFERFLRKFSDSERPGVPDDREIIEFYEVKAGTRLEDIEYFRRWAAFRLAVMRLRAGLAAIRSGLESPESRVDEINYGSIELAQVFGFPEPA